MQIKEGTIVTFTQFIHTPIHGNWGTFERTICYPNDIGPETVNAMKGMKQGDSLQFEFSNQEDKFYDDDLIFKVNTSMLKKTDSLNLGMVFKANFNNRELQGIITQLDKNSAVIDCNHPMIGIQGATSHIRILEVRPATETQLKGNFTPTTKVI